MNDVFLCRGLCIVFLKAVAENGDSEDDLIAKISSPLFVMYCKAKFYFCRDFVLVVDSQDFKLGHNDENTFYKGLIHSAWDMLAVSL